MADRYWEAAAKIVERQAGMRVMSETEMQDLIKSLSATLHEVAVTPADELKDLPRGSAPQPASHASDEPLPPVVEAQEAVQFDFIMCMECGQKFKIIKKNHLALHNLTPEAYREKYGYPANMPLMCKKQLKDRSEVMKSSQPWKHKGKSPEEKAAQAVTEEFIECLECGKKFQSITSPHLRKHGLTPEEYRLKWGYPDDMPLMSGKQIKKQALNASMEEDGAKPEKGKAPKAKAEKGQAEPKATAQPEAAAEPKAGQESTPRPEEKPKAKPAPGGKGATK